MVIIRGFSWFYLSFVLICGSQAYAQTDVYLHINHQLGSQHFTFDEEVFNGEGVGFYMTRLDYYISGVRLIHDGGNVTAIDSLWILVDADVPTEAFIGELTVDSVESIAFSIGVDSAHNHLDPTLWPPEHPLAHQDPLMHWGWTAGYRFVALEGITSGVSNQIFEVHSLGDEHYYETTVDVSGASKEGRLDLVMYADYLEALKNIDIASGLISHGSSGPSVTLLENFRDRVFSDTSGIDSTENPLVISDPQLSDHINVFPNPSSDGSITVGSSTTLPRGMVECMDVHGRVIASKTFGPGNITFTGLKPGMYVIRYVEPENGKQEIARAIVL